MDVPYSDLHECGWWCGPALVQDIFGQVPVQTREEGVTHIIQEVLILRTAFFVAEDEPFDEPGESWGQTEGRKS